MDGGGVITRVLFRSLLRTARELKRPLRVRLPINETRAQWLDPSSPQFCFVSETAESVRELFPALSRLPASSTAVSAIEL